MKTFEIKAIIGEDEQALTIQEESAPNSYRVSRNYKFVARIFKDPSGNWKTYEISDLNPSDINTIGEEITLFLENE